MTIPVIIGIIIIHLVADFVLQTEKEAQSKSSNNYALFSHVSKYSMAWLMASTMYCAGTESSADKAIIFYCTTFVSHFITDWATSRVNKSLLSERIKIEQTLKDKEGEDYMIESYHYPNGENYHNFFIGVGVDQSLHYIQLYLTFYYVFVK